LLFPFQTAHIGCAFSLCYGFILAVGFTAVADAQGASAPKVSVAAAYTQVITEEVTFTGRDEAIDKVDIVARVSGFLEETLVANGALVA